MDFTLDTSGWVDFGPHPEIELTGSVAFNRYVQWDDLSPFVQGYVEAALRELDAQRWAHYKANPGKVCVPLHPAYSWLHHEALAMILRDCEALTQELPTTPLTRSDGFAFWHSRQSGFRPGADAFHGSSLKVAFPPIRVSLDDAGKVRLEARP